MNFGSLYEEIIIPRMCECIANVQMSVKIRISAVEALKVARAASPDRELKFTSQVKDEQS